MANAALKRILTRRNSLNFELVPILAKSFNCHTVYCLNQQHAVKSSTFNFQKNTFLSGSTIANFNLRNYSDTFKKGESNKIVKLSLYQRIKQMYKDYWYVLVPVHLVTSAAWFGGFYYMAKSGVDIVAILESLNVSERVTNSLKDSSMGYLAVSYACYKIATPLRYTVTLGGATISINYLKKWGYIKPVPSAERLKEIYQEGKDNLLESVRETQHEIKVKSHKLKDKKNNLIDDLDKSISQIKKLGEKIKSKE